MNIGYALIVDKAARADWEDWAYARSRYRRPGAFGFPAPLPDHSGQWIRVQRHGSRTGTCYVSVELVDGDGQRIIDMPQSMSLQLPSSRASRAVL